MRGSTVLSTIDVHAEGETGRVLLGGHLGVRGRTMVERLTWCQENLEGLRTLLLREPRGHPAMCGVLVMPPVSETADISIIILEQGGFTAMSGANTMCAVTAVLETGSLPVTEPRTFVRIDTAAGFVEATARVSGGRVQDVEVRNVPSWREHADVQVEVPGYGAVRVDVAFGGQYYVHALAADLGLDLSGNHTREVVRAGAALLAATRQQVQVQHPTDPELSHIQLVMLHGPSETPGVTARNNVVLPTGPIDPHRPETWTGVLDRSPCGTGTSAWMAVLWARGELDLGVDFVHESVTGSTFTGILRKSVMVHGREAVVPSVRGRAWVTATTQILLDPTDPFPRGFSVGDIWAETSL